MKMIIKMMNRAMKKQNMGQNISELMISKLKQLKKSFQNQMKKVKLKVLNSFRVI